MSGRITSKSSNRLQIDTKHIWAQLIASKTKFPKSSASNRTTMIRARSTVRLETDSPPTADAFGSCVTPIRVRLSARSLLQAAENGGAGLRHARIDRLAPGHHRPAAFFDICRLFPYVGLFQLRQIVGGGGAALELVDADRRYRRNHRAIGRAVRQRLRRASKHPPAPAEADDESREDADGGAL